jgi:hypothetical protein
MPTFVAPSNDNARLGFLQSTKNAMQHDGEAGQKYVFAETQEKILAFLPGFEERVKSSSTLFGARSKEVDEKNVTYDRLLTYIKDGIEVCARMIRREELPVQTFSFYGLTLEGKAPSFGNPSETFEFVKQFIAGDEGSGKLGNPRIACPTAQEINDKYVIAKKDNDDVVAADRAYGQVQNELSSLRIEADSLINDIMADLRHSLRKLEGPAQRRIMMTYGARYKFLPGETPEDVPPAPKAELKETQTAGA